MPAVVGSVYGRRAGHLRVLLVVVLGQAAATFIADGQSDQVVLQRLLDFLGDALEPNCGFRSLLAFKSKFQPTLEPMHLVFPDEVALAEIGIGIAIARAYLPDASACDWAKMGAEMVTTPSA